MNSPDVSSSILAMPMAREVIEEEVLVKNVTRASCQTHP
jgi:hypothetical protein